MLRFHRLTGDFAMACKRRNPFTPTFGHEPFALAGREELIDDVIEGLAEGPGDPNRATIFLGPRGSGKTVLLSTIAEEASQMGWVFANAVTGTGMLKDLMYSLRTNASHLLERPGDSTIVNLQVGPVALGREVVRDDPPWRFRFQQVIEELNNQGIGVLFTVDEVDPGCTELIEFISFYQCFVTEKRDVAMLLAGLPGKVSDLLIEDRVSFVRRSFQRRLTSIPDDDVREAFKATIESNGKTAPGDILDELVAATRGFPYAMQLLGYGAWRYTGEGESITHEAVKRAIRRSAQEMEGAIVRPTMRECTTREIEYLQAMAEDEGPSATSDIARRMGIGMTNASNLRRRLIDRGIIKSERMGLVVFDMPILEAYLREHPGEW